MPGRPAFAEVEPAHTRKADIEDQASQDVLPLGIEKLPGLGAGLKATGAAEAVNRTAQELVIIDNVTIALSPVCCDM